MSESQGVDLRKEYFATLRQEILEVKARLAWLIVIGIVGSPFLTYFALTDKSELKVLLIVSPILVLLLLVLYFSEQTSMMRAGKYLHDKVEDADGWEFWMADLRKASSEPPIFGLFVIVAFSYFIFMASFAIDHLMRMELGNLSLFALFFCRYGVPVLYGTTIVWVLLTLAKFWHAAFRTD